MEPAQVIHPQAHDNYRVIQDEGEAIESARHSKVQSGVEQTVRTRID
jgi:hypothetical protein